MKKMYLIFISVLICLFFVSIPTLGTAGTFWTKSYYISQGQGVMHEIQVDSEADLVLYSPEGADYDLYAMRNTGAAGSCPVNEYIMDHADLSSTTEGIDMVHLSSGLWCVVVYAYSGSGTYLLEAGAGPVVMMEDPETIPPPADESGCPPYRTVENTGTLSPIKSVFPPDGTYILSKDTHHFKVSGMRTMVEWILMGSCEFILPDRVLSSDEVDTLTTGGCGPVFDMTVYPDCDPELKSCLYPGGSSSGSNAYILLDEPVEGSTYYVQITAEPYTDAADYTLVCRSYTCTPESGI